MMYMLMHHYGLKELVKKESEDKGTTKMAQLCKDMFYVTYKYDNRHYI